MIRKHVSETLQVAEDHVMTKAPQEHAKWQIHRRQVLFSATRSVLSQPLVIPCPITHSHVRSPLKRSCSNSNSFITSPNVPFATQTLNLSARSHLKAMCLKETQIFPSSW